MSDEKSLVLCFVRAAAPALETLPPAERADAYEGLHIVTRAHAPELSTQAQQIAAQLRDAEVLQGDFLRLLQAHA